MDKKQLEKTLENLRKNSPKKKFNQSIDLILNFRSLNLKNPEQQIDAFVKLPHKRGKEIKVGAFVGTELAEQAKTICNVSVHSDDFPRYAADKKMVKKLADSCDWFIGQATVMPNVAKVFGRYFGPKGKMPNPKAGCVVLPNANIKNLVEGLKNTIRVRSREQLSTKCSIGTEASSDNDLIENAMAVISAITAQLPQGEANIRNIILKTTMGPVIKVGAGEQK